MTEAASGAVAFSLTDADASAIGAAYVTFARFNGTCVQVVPGTFKAAVISATGVKWAFGQLQPAPGCTVNVDGNQVDARSVFPFAAGPLYGTGVFEQQPSGTWAMNSFESTAFPCPANLSLPNGEGAPGFNTPFVPLAVLNAVKVPYAATGCASAYAPPEPR